MAVAEPSPPAAAAAAAGQTHAGRVDALERMLTRLALTEDSVASLLCRFLPYTTISLVSPGASVRELLMENGSLFDKLVKQRPDISMMMDLWRIYTESTSTVVQNYCIVYVEMGFERLLSEDKAIIAPDLLINISNVPEQHQGIILRLVLKAIGEWDTHKVDQTVASKYKSISASNDGLVFADFCLHMILYQTPPQGIRCSAGLSVAQSDRVTGNLPLKGDTLASRKLGILDVIETMQFKLEIVYPLYLAAASDSQEAVAKRGEEMLILKASAVNLEDSDLIKRLFTLFNGTASSENIASELEVAPAHSSLRVRLMGVFCRSIAAANAFTHTFQCIFGCIYGNGTTSRLKQLGMEFTVWVFKHATNKQLKAISPFILSGILHSLDGSSTTEADSSSRDIRIFAYQAIGLLAFRMPNLFCNKTGMAIRLFTALRLEEQSLRSIIQEAATALATAYKGASNIVLKDFEALLLEYCQAEQSEVRFSAVRWAVTLYNMKHCPSRYICMLGASDVKLDIREMALAGLNLLNDERQSSTMATDISYPDIAEMVNYIYSQQPQLLHCYEQRNGKLLFPTDTFLAMIKFLMKCFNTHDGSDFLQEDLSNSTLAKMCVLLEHAMSYDGSSELHTLALKSLVDISSRQPKMVSSFYVNRLDWPRTLLHADTHEEAPRLLGYGRQCQNTTDINEELGSCCNGRTNHSLEHEVCGGGNNSDNLGGDGCDEELVTGCHHRHGRIDHNLEFLIDRMMSWSVRDILKAPPVIKKERQTGKKLGTGVRRDGLWYLDRKETSEDVCLALMASTSKEEAKVLLLHCRLGHISFETMSKMFPAELSRVDKHKLVCDACEYGKHTRTSYVSRGLRSMLPFMLIHSDVWTSPMVSMSGMKYFVTF
ncbi:Os12g0148400, partial [Oryza sativa Japonica Group]